MCGIAGILRVHEPSAGEAPEPLRAIPESWLDLLDGVVAHRGPDGAGRFRDRAVRPDGRVVDVALVHRRLSIIDPAGGGQPMVVDGAGRLRPDLVYAAGARPVVASEREPGVTAMVFNGCVYNHREVRAELEGEGERFGSSHSDSEVIVRGYRRWGAPVCDVLDSMHAVALWSGQAGTVMLSRDRFGEKPLYLSVDVNATGVHAFASVALGVEWVRGPEGVWVESGRVGRREHVARWIVRGWDDVTVPLRGCAVLRPGTQKWLGGYAGIGHTLDRWRGSGRSGGLSLTTRGQVEAGLREAVVSRLEADVPLGCFLSGGVDSSLIAWFARRELGALDTLTVRMPDPELDESAFAERAAAVIGSRHQTIEVSPRPGEDLAALIGQLGLPFGDSSLLAASWVSRAARGVVKVALSGDGGDELFGGYERYRAARWLESRGGALAAVPGWVASLLPARRASSRWTRLGRLLAAAKGAGYLDLVSVMGTRESEALLGLTLPREEADERAKQSARHARLWDFNEYLPGDLLRKTDTASMSVALEVRSPFLARGFAQAVLGASDEFLMPGGQRKGLLRAIAREHLPAELVDRPKQGFAVPVGRWFRDDTGGMRQLLMDRLHAADPFPGLASSGLELDVGVARRWAAEHDRAGGEGWPWSGRDHAQRLYVLVVLSLWCQWLAGQGSAVRATGAGGGA